MKQEMAAGRDLGAKGKANVKADENLARRRAIVPGGTMKKILPIVAATT